MKCRVVLFYIYSSSQQQQQQRQQYLYQHPPQHHHHQQLSEELSEQDMKEEEAMHLLQEDSSSRPDEHSPFLQDLIGTLLKYASWYYIYLAPSPQILLKGVASSKGPSDSRWSELISQCYGKVIKVSLAAALRNVSHWEDLSIGDTLEYGERPSLCLPKKKFKRKKSSGGSSQESQEEGSGGEEMYTRGVRKKPHLSVDDVIQASNLHELCEKKGIVQETLSANDYCQYIKTRKLLEKQNELFLNSSIPAGKRDAPFEYSPFFEWQDFLLTRMISQRPVEDKRKILFLVDPIGNNGKSVFFQWLSSLPAGAINKYLPLTLKDLKTEFDPDEERPYNLPENQQNIEFQYLTVEGKSSSSANDILYLVDCSQANCMTTQSIFLVDLARCEAQNLNYALLEKLKNGVWMSTKYEGKKASYKNGQVIVAMNELPDVTKLSQDRYEIYLLHHQKIAFEGKPLPVDKIPASRKLHDKFLQRLLSLIPQT